MKRVGMGLLWGIAGYIVAAVAGYFVLLELSSNRHDRELEAAMTSAFLLGPVGAVLAFVIGFVTSGRGVKSRGDG